MPDAPVPLPIPFTREFTITGWLDLPARDDSHECPVAVGTMADIPVTYLINRGDGRVRAVFVQFQRGPNHALVEEVKALMDRVNREKPGALSTTQRQEILLLSKRLSDAERDSCWLALMDAAASDDGRIRSHVLASQA